MADAPLKREYFSKVRLAREALQAMAMELKDLQVQIIKEAIAAQEYDTAAKANQWLIEHMPSDDEGTTMVSSSIDKAKEIVGHTGPTIQIGLALGGMVKPLELPSPKVEGPQHTISGEIVSDDEPSKS